MYKVIESSFCSVFAGFAVGSVQFVNADTQEVRIMRLAVVIVVLVGSLNKTWGFASRNEGRMLSSDGLFGVSKV